MPAFLRPFAVLVLCVAACGPENDDDAADSNGDDSASAEDDDASTGDATAGGQDCSDETRDDVYMLGLERSGEQLTVRFVDAVPAPPARFDNTWILEVVDLTGIPVADVALEVEPYMPDHMHGTSIATKVTVMDEPGQFELDPVNLFMPGLWEVRLRFTMPDTTKDEVVFRFCVDP
jgi:hypothetical protein